MKNKTILLAMMALGGLLISFEAITNVSGAPTGHSGSPASNGKTCAQAGCHLGGPSVTSQNITITTDIPALGFVPNTSYNITVTADAGAAGNSRIGFQASVEDGNGHAGTVSAASGNQKFGNYITHTSGSTTASGGIKTWTFTWNSGNTPTDATVYVAGNFANNNGLSTGDVIVTENLQLTKARGASVKEHELVEFQLSPNPAVDYVVIENLDADQVRLFTLDGRLVRNFSNDGRLEWKLDLKGISPGTYIIISSNPLYAAKTLVVKG